jgi:hypothetical protein
VKAWEDGRLLEGHEKAHAVYSGNGEKDQSHSRWQEGKSGWGWGQNGGWGGVDRRGKGGRAISGGRIIFDGHVSL